MTRGFSLLAVVVFAWAGTAQAQSVCTPHPNDTYGQGGSGKAGWALVNAFVVGAPQNFYPQGYPDKQTAINASYANSLKYAQALISVVQRQATSFPIGSSNGGFSYAFDPQIGLPVRRTQSFGPMFAERPQSGGVRKISVAISGQDTWWRSLGGVSLERGLTSIRSYPASVTDSGDPESDFSRTTVALVTARRSLGVTVGLTRRIDVGLVLTRGAASVDSVLDFSLTDLKTGQTLIVDGRHFCGLSAALGDTSVHAKVEFMSRPSLDLALGLDVELPTGDAEELLGVGATQTKLTLIGAVPRGGWSPHFNLGYTFVAGYTAGVSAHGVDIPPIRNSNEINYTVGADVAATTRLTLAGDLIGRFVLRSFSFTPVTEPLFSELEIKPGSVHLLVVAVGGKLLVWQSWLLNASVAFPINSAGLKPRAAAVFGLERVF